MNILYAVPWIEIEYGWGSRPEGYKIFADLVECISTTIKSSENGNYDGGYCGPERPLCYYEIPKDSIDQNKMKEGQPFFVDSLHFKSRLIPINDDHFFDKSR